MFATIALRSWICVQAALLLAFTTPFHELVDGLRELRLPQVMVSIISFMYRYLGVLADEATRMSRARASRSADPDGHGGGSLAWRAKVTGAMVGSLFLRSYERGERITRRCRHGASRASSGTCTGVACGRRTSRCWVAWWRRASRWSSRPRCGCRDDRPLLEGVAGTREDNHTHGTRPDHVHLVRPTDIVDVSAAVPVVVEHLHFRYPDGFEALHGIDLAIAPGEKVAIVGPNGAGKSTLLLHLNGSTSPSTAP